MSLTKQIRDYVQKLPNGSVFSSKDLPISGSGSTVDVILHRLALTGCIRKIGYGLYDKPIKSDLLGDLAPNMKSVISAYGRKLSQVFVLDPLNAANLLGITTQVPAKLIYLTNGKTHKLSIIGTHVYFIHKSPKTLLGADTKIGVLLQAIRYSDHISDDLLKKISSLLTQADLDTLQGIRRYTYKKVAQHIDRINEIAAIH